MPQLTNKPNWVRQSDFDLANRELAGPNADAMARFLAAVANQGPQGNLSDAIERRMGATGSPTPSLMGPARVPVGVGGNSFIENLLSSVVPSGAQQALANVISGGAGAAQGLGELAGRGVDVAAAPVRTVAGAASDIGGGVGRVGEGLTNAIFRALSGSKPQGPKGVKPKSQGPITIPG